MEDSITFAKKYTEDLLSFFGLNTDVYATSEDGEVIELHVPSTHLNGFLIGQNADTLRSLQYVVSMALKNADKEVTRVNVDVADYKKQRAHRLEDHAKEWLNEVKRTGKERHLEPMNPADRRTIHRLAGEYGLLTASEGFGRDRHIVLKPEGTTGNTEAAANRDDAIIDAKTDETLADAKEQVELGKQMTETTDKAPDTDQDDLEAAI